MTNKRGKISFVAGFLLGALAFGSIGAFAKDVITITRPLTATFADIRLYIDGQRITPADANGNTVEPFIVDGTTYLPVRAVAEAFGKDVEWDGDAYAVYIGAKPTAPAETPFPYKVGETPTACNSQSDWMFALPDNDFHRQFSLLNSIWTGSCGWYAEGRFHEVTGVFWEDCLGDDIGIHTDTKTYLALTKKHPERLDAITDMLGIRSQSIALYYYEELEHGHLVFVEYVERDPEGNPLNVYYTQANGYLSANYRFDDGIDGIVQAKTYDEFIKDCIGFIALNISA
jgi:hypothetical protein